MAQIGNKQNSYLNGLWRVHIKKSLKRQTSKKRRRAGRAAILEQQYQ